MSSSTDQFWQYAKEAVLSALSAESDDDRKSLLELAQTWTRAAMVEQQLADTTQAASVGGLFSRPG
ncbi:MAG TPA: hypothetical protein VHU22_11575 [Xanthobacteraceae bacterium]|jgi:hypothetical protein|nr:hypothetical protein [Xanthobacteraceae bacterium]